MKRRWTITLLAIPVAVLVAMLLTYRHHTVPLEQCSELYRRYEHNPHIKASYLRNIHINDSVAVDVTMLQTADTIGWELLQKDFGITLPPPRALALMDSNAVAVRLAPKEDYSRPIDKEVLANNDVLAIAMLRKQVCVFHVENENQIISLLHYQYQ